MSTKFEFLVMIMKIILFKKAWHCSHYFSFGQHYSCNLTDRQAFFIMEASTDQKNFHDIMRIMAVNIGPNYFHNEIFTAFSPIIFPLWIIFQFVFSCFFDVFVSQKLQSPCVQHRQYWNWIPFSSFMIIKTYNLFKVFIKESL